MKGKGNRGEQRKSKRRTGERAEEKEKWRHFVKSKLLCNHNFINVCFHDRRLVELYSC